ncbi:hypothetical protein ACFL0M_01625 [Thermodesulfobacteriota bacterium]
MMPSAYGWRARIGMLNPTIIDSTFPYEFYKVAPPGVMLLSRNLSVTDVRVQADLDASLAVMETAVKELTSAGADLIVGSGIPVLLSEGPDGLKKILKLLEDLSGLPAISTLSSAVEAFQKLEVTRIAIATAYGKAELGENLADFLKGQGFEIAGLSTIDTGLTSIEKHKLDFGFVYRYGKKVFRKANKPQALYFPSAAWPTVEYVELLEEDIGAPVVGSALAGIWNSLRVLGIHEPIRNYGQLLGTL